MTFFYRDSLKLERIAGAFFCFPRRDISSEYIAAVSTIEVAGRTTNSRRVSRAQRYSPPSAGSKPRRYAQNQQPRRHVPLSPGYFHKTIRVAFSASGVLLNEKAVPFETPRLRTNQDFSLSSVSLFTNPCVYFSLTFPSCDFVP